MILMQNVSFQLSTDHIAIKISIKMIKIGWGFFTISRG